MNEFIKMIELRYGNKHWIIYVNNAKNYESTIKLIVKSDDVDIEYGVVVLSRDPKSCTISLHPVNMPYSIVTVLMKYIEIEIKRLGIKFE